MIYSENFGQAGTFLSLALRGRRSLAEDAALVELYRRLGDEECNAIAARNRAEPLVAVALQALLSANLPSRWRGVLAQNERRVLALLDALRAIVKRLDASGCRSAVVESAGVMLATGLPVGGLCSGDFDLLVDREHWSEVREQFEAEGFRPADKRGRPTYRMEYRRAASDGTEQWLEVGFAPFDRMWVPLRIVDRCPLWLSRTQPSRKAPELCVLEPADALAFAAMHTSLHSFVRAPGFRLHTDVDRLVRDCEVDWGRFVENVSSMGVRTRAFVSLSMAAGLLATPIPPEVLRKIYPGKLRWAALESLISHDGVLSEGRKKLPGLRALVLDGLLDEKGLLSWAGSVLWPDERWLRDHFDRKDEWRGRPWWLHFRRAQSMIRSWRPE